MTLLVLPDIDEVLFQFLSGQPELAALPPRAPGIWTDLPPGWLDLRPLILLYRFGGQPVVDRPLVADGPRVQYTVWGGSKKEAARIVNTLRALITERLTAEVPNVAHVRWGSVQYLPDTVAAAGKSIPRYLLDEYLITRGAS